jgi:hypothetical protein
VADLIEFLFSNLFILLIILYVVFSTLFRLLKGATGESTQQQQAPSGEKKRGERRKSWSNPWDEHAIDPDPDPREVGELRERAERLSSRRPEPANPPLVPHTVTKQSSSPWARLPKEEWKRGIILKEILDAPKARRRRGLR